MKQLEARFKQVDVFSMVKYYMDELDLLIYLKNMCLKHQVPLWIMLKAYLY